ncbi:hypothetical protein ACFL1H_05525 [Nanoarchaeota archaeon]
MKKIIMGLLIIGILFVMGCNGMPGYKDCGVFEIPEGSYSGSGYTECFEEAAMACEKAVVITKANQFDFDTPGDIKFTSTIEGRQGDFCKIKLNVDRSRLTIPSGVEIPPGADEFINMIQGMEGKSMTCLFDIGDIPSPDPFDNPNDEGCSGSLKDYVLGLEGFY